jgi:hypothetical protein
MSTPSHPDPQPPQQTTGDRRRWLVVAGIAVAVLVGVLLVWWIAGAAGSSPDLNRTDPAATATAFIQRYAVHDPRACELVTPDFRLRLNREGRCTGATQATTPRIDVVNAKTCGNRSGLSAEVNPAGDLGKPYVTVGLELMGGRWAVRSVLPIGDRSVIRPYDCAPPNTE